MNCLHSTRTLHGFSLALVLLAVLMPLDVKGPIINPPGITNVQFPQIGTLDKVNAFAVHTVNRIFTTAWYYDTNGHLQVYGTLASYGSIGSNPYIYGPLTNKYDLDQECASNVVIMLSSFMTNTDQDIDKSKGLNVYLHCQAYSGIPSLDTFYWYSPHVYLAGTNGNYTLPDLSSLSSQLNSEIPLYLPGLQWARYDVGDAGNSNAFEVDDSALNSTYPIDSDGFLDLPTDYVTDSSSTNGQFWIKITAFTTDSTGGKLWIWNGDGNQMTELSVKRTGTDAMVAVNGAYSDQSYTLQRSSDLVHWSDFTNYTVSPMPGTLPQFSWPFSPATNMFYRTEMTNVPPP